MKKNGHKLFTLVALLGTAAGVIHIANRFIDATSQLKDMLEQPHSKTYDWRFGKIHYTKQGHGAPLLLVHDMMPGASGYEWSSVEKQLATEQKSRILLTPILYMLNYFAILQKMLFSRKQTLLPAAFPDPLQLWHIVIILIISEKLCLSIRQASVL